MDRALLIGIDHYKFERTLKGCLNDVAAMESFLVERCGFSSSVICKMPEEKATRTNILQALRRLVEGVVPGDRVVFHFSGHGSQLPTLSKPNEPDGLDEIICPIDFRSEVGSNGVRDRDFRSIFGSLPPGVRFVWISDSCSSGDLAKLALLANVRKVVPTLEMQKLIQIAIARGYQPLTLLGAAKQLNLAFLAACAANGTAHETTVNGVTRGLFTHLLLERLSGMDGLTTPLPMIVGEVARRCRGARQIPEIAGAPTNLQASFLGVTANATFGARTSKRKFASFGIQEAISMADEKKRPLCRANYEAARLPNDVIVITATGSHLSAGYVVDFEPVDNGKGDTFRLVHTPPETENGQETAFTELLTLTGFQEEFVNMQDATGETRLDLRLAPVEAVQPELPLTDDIGRGFGGKRRIRE